MRRRIRQLPVALAAIQVADVVGNILAPQKLVEAHYDHLQVPTDLRPLLTPIKLASSVGLLAGLAWPKLGVATSAGLVAYYLRASRFHVEAGDHPVLVAPAASLAACAGVALVGVYLPAVSARTRRSRGFSPRR